MFKTLQFRIVLLILFFTFLYPQFALAETVMNYQVNIGAPKTISNRSIGDYIGTVYQIAMGVVGVLAVVVMMFGGIMWMMAGGSPERIQSAKGWIFGAMSGLVLAFSSYTILNIINPNLVKFKAINGIKNPENIPETNTNTRLQINANCVVSTAPLCEIGLRCVDGKCTRDSHMEEEAQSGKYRWQETDDCSKLGKINYGDYFCPGTSPTPVNEYNCCGTYD